MPSCKHGTVYIMERTGTAHGEMISTTKIYSPETGEDTLIMIKPLNRKVLVYLNGY